MLPGENCLLGRTQKSINITGFPFKESVARDGFFCSLHPIQDRKKGPEIFFHVVAIFTELGQDFTHLADSENTQSDIFLRDRRKILIVFCSLVALIYYSVSHG
jgi:hypothetical protein